VLPSPVVEVRRVDNSLSKQVDQELHDYVLAVANFLDRGEAPPDAARILARRAWQRLARREVGRRWLSYAMRAVAASAVASERSGEELRRACRDLARRVPLRLASQAPQYHRLIETVPKSARA
jgi:hypothetical protein